MRRVGIYFLGFVNVNSSSAANRWHTLGDNEAGFIVNVNGARAGSLALGDSGAAAGAAAWRRGVPLRTLCVTQQLLGAARGVGVLVTHGDASSQTDGPRLCQCRALRAICYLL